MADTIYLILAICLVIYLGYSWYQQVNIEINARYKWASIFWGIIFIRLGFSWDYLAGRSNALVLLLAAFSVVCILNGQGGLAKTGLVLNGYFRRTLAYSKIEKIVLINLPSDQPVVLVRVRTSKNFHYQMLVKKAVGEILVYLQNKLGKHVSIEVTNLI